MTEHATMPSQQELLGNWNEIKGRLKEKWGQLSEDQLERLRGKKDQLIGYVQQVTGDTRASIESFMSQMSEQAPAMMAKMRDTAAQYTSQAADKIREGYEQAADTMAESYAGAQDMVRKRPTESVAVAFGAGVLLGISLTLMLRSR